MARLGTVGSFILTFALVGAQFVRAAQPFGVVQLDRGIGWAIGDGEGLHQGALAREITRQALLIAARAELGLATGTHG